ncbi:BglG family transcription antiterminator [Pantoea coffeiphila]|uniref:Uncharacterized protein n=1 Tax=Pantoea coffeiphila TaxID=1465635 RepID=A0A2S9IHQ3_9GAMM|nr:PRD domain-containing protein [Pantoea coffeiphila]PRD17304.1 hypothetical protein CQW29_01325 [Pantoea coffeiphila]
MRLFTNKRVRDIFVQIAKGPATQAFLAKEMNVSTRTIRSDLKELSDIIPRYGISLLYDRKTGFEVKCDDPASYHALLEESDRPVNQTRSAADRRKQLMALLLRQQGYVALEELESDWFISIYSLKNDVALLKRHFSFYQIAVNAVGNERLRIAGDEVNIRRCIYDHLLRSTETESDYRELFACESAFSEIKNALSQLLVNNQLRFSDVNLRSFTLCCGIALERIRGGNWLLDYDFNQCDTLWKPIARQVLQLLLADQSGSVPPGEVNYMAMNLSAFCSVSGDSDLPDRCYDAELTVMNHFLSYVSSVWYCDVSYDEQSKKNLLNHIKAMRTRVNHGITIINPLLDQIKRHYPLMYEMTLTAFSELDNFFTGKLSDDEIGYLVMHIGAVLEDTLYQHQGSAVSALIVSDQGMASTRIVSQRIVRMYPNMAIGEPISVQQYQAMENIAEDVVISMVPVVEKNRKVINLPALPERWQLENIKYYLTNHRSPADTVMNYFSPAHFFIFEQSEHNKDSLIEFLARRLESTGKVDARYLPSVVEREAHASTLLADKIAIPHPMGLVASTTQVTVAVFPQGIEWDVGKVVKLVFMLAISEDAFVDSMIIYDYLTNILDDDIIDKLSASGTFADFMCLSGRYFI